MLNAILNTSTAVEYLQRASHALVIWCTGDLLAQGVGKYLESEEVEKGEEKNTSSRSSLFQIFHPLEFYRSTWDGYRTLRTAGFATLVYASMMMRWYIALDRIFPHADKKSIFQRVLSDHLIWTPTIFSFYFGYMSIFDDNGFGKGIFYKMKFEMLALLLLNWGIWIPYQAFVFTVVPMPVWAAAMDLGMVPWTGYISYNNKKSDEFQKAMWEEHARQLQLEEKMKVYVRESAGTERRPAKLIR